MFNTACEGAACWQPDGMEAVPATIGARVELPPGLAQGTGTGSGALPHSIGTSNGNGKLAGSRHGDGAAHKRQDEGPMDQDALDAWRATSAWADGRHGWVGGSGRVGGMGKGQRQGTAKCRHGPRCSHSPPSACPQSPCLRRAPGAFKAPTHTACGSYPSLLQWTLLKAMVVRGCRKKSSCEWQHPLLLHPPPQRTATAAAPASAAALHQRSPVSPCMPAPHCLPPCPPAGAAASPCFSPWMAWCA